MIGDNNKTSTINFGGIELKSTDIEKLRISESWGGRTIVFNDSQGYAHRLGKINDLVKILSNQLDSKSISAVEADIIYNKITELSNTKVSSKILYSIRNIFSSGRAEKMKSIDDTIKSSVKEELGKLDGTLSKRKKQAVEIIFNKASNNINGEHKSNLVRLKLMNEISKTKESKPGSLEINGHMYVISKSKKGETNYLIAQTAEKAFAEGSFGSVYDVTYLTGENRSTDVMKVAKDGKTARTDVINEKKLLDEIHSHGPVKGIQAAPHTVIMGKIVGYLAPKYEMDGNGLLEKIKSKKMEFSKDKKEAFTDNLISGLNTLHNLGIYHGDIKPANILYRKDELVISDLGGARKFSNLAPNGSFPSLDAIVGTYSPLFVSSNIIDKVDEKLLSIENTYNKTPDAQKEAFLKEKIETEIKPLLQKNDQFALGLSLYMTFTGEEPQFKRDETNLSIVDNNFLETAKNNLAKHDLNPDTQKKIMELLSKGLS